jgi:hypothetical protein
MRFWDEASNLGSRPDRNVNGSASTVNQELRRPVAASLNSAS